MVTDSTASYHALPSKFFYSCEMTPVTFWISIICLDQCSNPLGYWVNLHVMLGMNHLLISNSRRKEIIIGCYLLLSLPKPLRQEKRRTWKCTLLMIKFGYKVKLIMPEIWWDSDPVTGDNGAVSSFVTLVYLDFLKSLCCKLHLDK